VPHDAAFWCLPASRPFLDGYVVLEHEGRFLATKPNVKVVSINPETKKLGTVYRVGQACPVIVGSTDGAKMGNVASVTFRGCALGDASHKDESFLIELKDLTRRQEVADTTPEDRTVPSGESATFNVKPVEQDDNGRSYRDPETGRSRRNPFDTTTTGVGIDLTSGRVRTLLPGQMGYRFAGTR